MKTCMAGVEAVFDGSWTEPCTKPGRNVIGSDFPLPLIYLCDDHFAEVNAAGLVTEPDLGVGEAGRDEFERRHGWRSPRV